MIPIEVKDDGGRLTRRSVQDIYADLTAALRSAGLWGCLDYFEISIAMKRREDTPFPNFEWLSCSPVTGGAGGNYIHVGTISKSKYSLIFVGKTSQGLQTACEVANMCARELSA